MNYKGYFKGRETNHTYCAKIITNSASTSYTEITMAGDSPFTVSYDTSATLFEPVRTSTATIQIVNDDYVLDTFSPYATGTIMTLTDEDTGELKWKGYLKPNLYDQTYENCDETIQLEGSDCLAALQYFTYETKSGTSASGEFIKGVTTFEDILQRMFVKCGISKYYVMDGKKIDGNSFSFSSITISEENFFSSDTDDGWTLDEVLEEIARYAGFTVLQWGDAIYFIDYNALGKQTTNTFNGMYYNGSTWSAQSQIMISGVNEINADTYRGNGGSISMDTIYNKATVRASTYNVEDFLPDIWDDDNCHNRYGDWYNCSYIQTMATQKYISSHGKLTEEESSDSDTVYVHRLLDNDYYKSRYYDDNDITAEEVIVNSDITSKTVSVVGTDPEKILAVISSFSNTGDTTHTIDYWVVKTVDLYEGETPGTTSVSDSNHSAFTINAGETLQCQLQAQPTIPTGAEVAGSTYETYFLLDGSTVQHNIGAETTGEDKLYIGCTLVDLADYERIPQNTYNFEPTASLSFTRYLCLSQRGYPFKHWFYGYEGDYTVRELMLDEPDIDYSQHPSVYELKSGFNRPLIYGDGSYIAINCDALCTRYRTYNYINSEWTDEATGLNTGFLGIGADHKVAVGGKELYLIFKLGIGDKYWNGSTWTTTETCFQVPMSTQVKDDYETDRTKLWNTTFHVLNNFSWEEWTGAEGYRVPLNDSLDPSGEITFEIHVPTKMQFYENLDDTKLNAYGKSTLNGYVWITNLKLDVCSDNQEINEEDIVYENVIDEKSINELSEITCKINTNPGNVPLSYSFAGNINGGFLETITEVGMTAQKPEENIIEKMVNEYSTPTRKEQLTLNMDFTPFKKIKDNWWNDNLNMAILGQEIDYEMERQTITAIELK